LRVYFEFFLVDIVVSACHELDSFQGFARWIIFDVRARKLDEFGSARVLWQ